VRHPPACICHLLTDLTLVMLLLISIKCHSFACIYVAIDALLTEEVVNECTNALPKEEMVTEPPTEVMKSRLHLDNELRNANILLSDA